MRRRGSRPCELSVAPPKAERSPSAYPDAVRQDFPPLASDPALRSAPEALRIVRERQHLRLADIAERTRIDASTLAGLEAGTLPKYPTTAYGEGCPIGERPAPSGATHDLESEFVS